MELPLSPQVIMGVGAFLLLAVAGGIVRVQRRAKHCPVHSQRVGAAAWVVAGVCGLGGIGLLLFALLLE